MVRVSSRSDVRASEDSEFKRTLSGSVIRPFTRGLPKQVESLCPECAKIIEATIYEEDGKVWMEKTCPAHGYVKDLYWSDVELYLKAERVNFGDGEGFSNPTVRNAKVCPSSCGLCNMHTSATACGNLDLTNRCNLKCPICFANANVQGYVCEPSYEEILDMMRKYRELQPIPTGVIQFSGGEPTIHPRFLDIVSAARDMGFTHIQIASNGIKFLDPDFARAAHEAGLHTIYLQFDGMNEGLYKKTRGRDLLKDKLDIMKNVREAADGKMRIVFVPTIVRGVNDDQVGPILQCAIENRDIISGISYQPVAFTGRISQRERSKKRYTLPDLAFDIERQTGLLNAREDWFPLACVQPFAKLTSAVWGRRLMKISCHPHCSIGTYLFIDGEGITTPITQFIDVEGMLRKMDELAARTQRSRFRAYTQIKTFSALKPYFNEEKAPLGMSFADFLQTLYGLVDKKAGREEKSKFHMMLVAGMHFMDGYNYEVERVKRCVIHYSAPNGKLYPFCSYNAGPTYRKLVERKCSVTMEEYKNGANGSGASSASSVVGAHEEV